MVDCDIDPLFYCNQIPVISKCTHESQVAYTVTPYDSLPELLLNMANYRVFLRAKDLSLHIY